MSRTRKITVSKLLRPHGLNGEMHIEIWSDSLEAFKAYGQFEIQGRMYSMLSLRGAEDALLIKLEGVDTREAAEKLKGSEMSINREQASAVVLLEDYIGLEVFLSGDVKPIGKIGAWYDAGSGGVFEVELTDRKRLVPSDLEHFSEPDLEKGRVVLKIHEGLLD